MKPPYYYLLDLTEENEEAIKTKGYTYNGGPFPPKVIARFTRIFIWKNRRGYRYALGGSQWDLNDLNDIPDYSPTN